MALSGAQAKPKAKDHTAQPWVELGYCDHNNQAEPGIPKSGRLMNTPGGGPHVP